MRKDHEKLQTGIYVHVPFCEGKCPYCDFYSVAPKENERVMYTGTVISEMRKYRGSALADTLYFGGGTPILIGADRIKNIICFAKECFGLENSEITLESNPGMLLRRSLSELREAGVNRLSIGMQSAVPGELSALGRIHSPRAVEETVSFARSAGFENISVDWMLGIPHQDKISLEQTASFIEKINVDHVSAYMLKIEKGTPFYEKRESIGNANDDLLAEMYMEACRLLEQAGFEQYEISNFAKNGKTSRHNLKYWKCVDYLGFGPSAHSFFAGERFFHPRDLQGYISRQDVIADGPGGGFEEFAMLGLRLSDGISARECKERYGHGIPDAMRRKAQFLQSKGMAIADADGIRLTRQGFLVSNMVIAELLLSIE